MDIKVICLDKDGNVITPKKTAKKKAVVEEEE